MRICRLAVAVALILFSTASAFENAAADSMSPGASVERRAPDIDMFVSMAGRCSTLNVAGRDFACTSVAFFHSLGGRSNFTIALNDPEDESHIISFSGEKVQRAQDDLFERSIDRMLLNSKDRPKVDGLPTPAVEPSSGICRQIGSFATQRVSTISCTAIDGNSGKYELQFESDGSPIKVQRIRVAELGEEEQRAKVVTAHIEQLRCRHKADAERVLPRDRTAYILRCMEEE
jgi:hypothetical protein